MADKKNLKARIKSEAQACIGCTNDMMVCKDCVLRFDDSIALGNASTCEAFPDGKPIAIIFGDVKECDKYVKE